MNLYDLRQRLNISLTELLASTVQFEALEHAGQPISAQTFITFFERAALCIELVCAIQEEVVRGFVDQLEKGK